jgi:subtilase family protein
MKKEDQAKESYEPSDPSAPSEMSVPVLGDAETTGRYIVAFREGAAEAGIEALRKSAGISKMSSASELESGTAAAAKLLTGRNSVLFEKLDVAVVAAEPDQAFALRTTAEEGSAILAVEPERICHALTEDIPTLAPQAEGPTSFVEYLRGYKDAVDHLYKQLTEVTPEEIGAEIRAAGFADTAVATWGLQATRVLQSRFSGRGIRVAVLDTGLDLRHPDFAGRRIVSRSFIPGQAVQDGHGHGTHCIGTACGPQAPGGGRRYGIAYNSEIYAGKVLSNQGSGADGGILAGINWAVTNRCRVVSMSLGARVLPGQSFSMVYELVARRALALGTLIVAAAGNDSDRTSGSVSPVSHPANCPSIMAVAAIDANLRVANFSNRAINLNGGKMDIAGPGVAVYSSWPMPVRYRSISGTSMATPHVAGIAALFAEARGSGGATLWQALTGAARPLRLPSVDVGSGLVQAPVN